MTLTITIELIFDSDHIQQLALTMTAETFVTIGHTVNSDTNNDSCDMRNINIRPHSQQLTAKVSAETVVTIVIIQKCLRS